MLKKSLIAVAVLAIALPAVAGEIKVHNPWPVEYVWQNVCQIDVTMDVGYYIHVKNQDPIKVAQLEGTDANPYYTYYGCSGNRDIVTNFNATIKGSVASKSSAGGSWTAYFNGVTSLALTPGTTPVDICIKGTSVNITKLTTGGTTITVAQLTIKVMATDLL